mmetsp:Transcript_24721/g.58704  ORF Transcript_24721/g.58704 Transcript_24721/m.58704 type:complete len:233 (+) Transcript_24721:647-1345(+)
MLLTPLCSFSALEPMSPVSAWPQVTTPPLAVKAANAASRSPQVPTTETMFSRLPAAELLSPPYAGFPQVTTSPFSFNAAKASCVRATDTTPLRSWSQTSGGGLPPASALPQTTSFPPVFRATKALPLPTTCKTPSSRPATPSELPPSSLEPQVITEPEVVRAAKANFVEATSWMPWPSWFETSFPNGAAPQKTAWKVFGVITMERTRGFSAVPPSNFLLSERMVPSRCRTIS